MSGPVELQGEQLGRSNKVFQGGGLERLGHRQKSDLSATNPTGEWLVTLLDGEKPAAGDVAGVTVCSLVASWKTIEMCTPL